VRCLRVVTAYLYLQHGTAKLLHVPHLPEFDQLRLLSRDGSAGMLEITSEVPGTVVSLTADDTQGVRREQTLLELAGELSLLARRAARRKNPIVTAAAEPEVC